MDIDEQYENLKTYTRLRNVGTFGRRSFVGDPTIFDISNKRNYGSFNIYDLPKTLNYTNILPKEGLNIVNIPENIKLYHGSAGLAKSLILMPLGKVYFDTLKKDGPTSEEIYLANVDINEFLSQFGIPIPAWFSDPHVASTYSCQSSIPVLGNDNCCEPKRTIVGFEEDVAPCVLAFNTTREITMIIIEDSYNIEYIKKEFLNLTDNEVNMIQKKISIFTDIKLNRQILINYLANFIGFNYEDIMNWALIRTRCEGELFESYKHYKIDTRELVKYNRKSDRSWDIPLTVALCFIFNKNNLILDGYANNNTYTKSMDNYFHLEFTFCNAASGLERDYENPIDWQYNSNVIRTPVKVKNYISEIKKYKVLNYKNYSGNLYENAIWTLLMTEHIINNNPILFEEWIVKKPVSIVNDSYKIIISLVSFLYNFRQTQSCIPKKIFGMELFYCDLDEKFISNIIPPYRLIFELLGFNAINYLGHSCACVKIFLDIYDVYINPTIHIKDKLSFFVDKYCNANMMYNLEISHSDLINIHYILCTVIISSLYSRSSTFPTINYLSNNNLNADGSVNLTSVYFPYLSNVSKEYPGTTEYSNENTLNYFINLQSNIVTNYDNNILIQIWNKKNNKIHTDFVYSQTVEKVFFYRCLGYYDHTNCVNIITFYRDINNQLQNTPNPLLQIGNMVEKLKVDIPSDGAGFLVNQQLYEIILSENYAFYMFNTTMRLNLQLNEGSSIRSIGTNESFRLINVLESLKPILGIVFEELSVKNYPNLISNPPRFNHNSLNNLRQMWFTALFLRNSTLISRYSTEDLFFILLTSFFKSIGRVNEAGKITSFDLLGLFSIFDYPGLLKNIAPEKTSKISSVNLNTMSIFNQVLIVVLQKFSSVRSNLISNLLYCVSEYPQLKLKKILDKKLYDLCILLNVGHYFDHCRPTTSFSQLDTEGDYNASNPNSYGPDKEWVENVPHGQDLSRDAPLGKDWLKDFLNEYKTTKDWISYKKLLYDKITNVMISSGFEINENRVEVDIKYGWSNRCRNEFKNILSSRFVELSENFDLAWNTICDYDELM